jgi:hypothetical protein
VLAGMTDRCSRLMAWRVAPGQKADGNSQRLYAVGWISWL